MADNNMQRKLRAIFSADVKGYSKLMGDDDEHTINTITSYRKIVTELIEAHHGRVVDAPGDNILAEFSGALNAVSSAIEIQQKLEAQNGKLPDNRRMDFRIGINLGDIVHKENRIYGDGVNVAARIESLADPGGICISRGIFDQVKRKVRYGFEYLGEHSVKNISEPVRIYRVLLSPEFDGKVIGEPVKQISRLKRPYAIATSLILIFSAALLLFFYPRQPDLEPASVEKMAYPLPDQPSIAVLPFDNMSGDPDQEYFSDGITEHIITWLSKVPYILVIARNSTFTYKNKPVKVQQIAEELGVRYILEGSVQRSDNRVRITAQLVDALKGHHLWAESYDRKLEDVFHLQDEIAMKIMAEMQVELTFDELGRFSAIQTKNIKAYEKYLIGYEYLQRRTEADTQQARKFAQESISLDPGYGAPYLLLAKTYIDDVWYYKSKNDEDSLDTAERLVYKATELSGQDATAHQILGSVYYLRREYDKAIAECAKAIDLSPNSAEANYYYGHALRWAGRFDEAIVAFKKSIRLNPIKPLRYMNNLAWAYALSGQHEKAIALWTEAIDRNPDYSFAYLGLALTYQLSGKEDKARSAASEVLRLKPNLTISKLSKGPATKNVDRERNLEALHQAGIPR